jgi:hypothetical protein
VYAVHFSWNIDHLVFSPSPISNRSMDAHYQSLHILILQMGKDPSRHLPGFIQICPVGNTQGFPGNGAASCMCSPSFSLWSNT